MSKALIRPWYALQSRSSDGIEAEQSVIAISQDRLKLIQEMQAKAQAYASQKWETKRIDTRNGIARFEDESSERVIELAIVPVELI